MTFGNITLRGVGLTKAADKIQIDRYSSMSEAGTDIAFLDTANTFGGWKTILSNKDAWIKYNSVDFGQNNWKFIKLRAKATNGSKLEIHIGNPGAFVSTKVSIPKNANWQIVSAKIKDVPEGIQNIGIILRASGITEIDWMMFE